MLVPSPPAMPTRIPVDRHRTVVSVLREAAQVNGDIEAYVEPGVDRRAITFGEWDRAAEGVAGFLARCGVTKGDVVCLLLPSSIEYAVLYAAPYGSARSLRASIPGWAAPRWRQSSNERSLRWSWSMMQAADCRLRSPPVRAVGTPEARAAWDGAPPTSWPELNTDDPVAVVWTSGTTGRPKGAIFDHANLAAVARGTDVLSQPGDRRLSPLPFAHVGYMTRAWDEIANVVTTVITPTPWRADEAIDVMARERVTVAQGVPTQWALMLASERLDRADLSALRVAGTGAARMPASMVAEVRRRLGVPVVVRYTSTETSLGTGTTLTSTDDEVATTVGRPVAGVELAIVDDEGGAVPDGSVGRVLLRSAAVMRGYWGQGPARGRRVPDLVDPTTTEAVLGDDGWLTTGDFGRLTPEGQFAAFGPRPRALHPGWLQRLSRARSSRYWPTTPASDGSQCAGYATTSWVRSEWPSWSRPPERRQISTRCACIAGGPWPITRRPTRSVVVDELPLTPMMKVDPVRLGALAEGAAAARRDAGARNRRERPGC